MSSLREARDAVSVVKYQAVLYRLRDCRKKAGLTQAEAAAVIGIKTSGFSSIERGEAPLRVLHVFKLCRAYGVSPMFVMTGLPEIDGLAQQHNALRRAIDDIAEIIDGVR